MHPAFGFIAAFAEAATIGGLADWYAVVALFRRPLGLPIPHTAIIQGNQHRIADKLGEFIELHFLEAAPVEAKLRQIDFGSFIADWLRDRKRSDDLARFALRLLPEAVSATETSGPDDLHHPPHHHAIAVDRSGAARRRHAARLRAGGPASGPARRSSCAPCIESLTKPETMAMIREKIRDELPTLLKLYRADKFLVNKIVASATAFFEEVRNDPKHPFRGEFDRMVLSFVDRLGSDPGLCRSHRRLEARPAGASRTRRPRAKHLVEHALVHRAQRQPARPRCCSIIWPACSSKAGEALAGDSELRAEINQGLVAVLRSFIADQKSGVSSFISDQVKAWDMGQLISLIEINIGRDLQYIRFNGSLIGGLAGLALYTVEFLLRWL